MIGIESKGFAQLHKHPPKAKEEGRGEKERGEEGINKHSNMMVGEQREKLTKWSKCEN